MTNVTSITKAPRLTEEEVHHAAEELKASGNKVSSTNIYKHLGRGSLTTITNYLKTWNQDKPEETNALPDLTDLPESLKAAIDRLAVEIWAEAKAVSDREIESQRDALKQAEAKAKERIDEAEAFSEEQANRIEELESEIRVLKRQEEILLSETEKEKETLLEQKHQLETKIAILFERKEKQDEKLKDLESYIENIKQCHTGEIEERKRLEAENKRLDMQTAKQQLSLDSLSKTMEETKKNQKAAEAENRQLIEKIGFLEGELNAWKTLKPKTPARNSRAKTTGATKAKANEEKTQKD